MPHTSKNFQMVQTALEPKWPWVSPQCLVLYTKIKSLLGTDKLSQRKVESTTTTLQIRPVLRTKLLRFWNFSVIPLHIYPICIHLLFQSFSQKSNYKDWTKGGQGESRSRQFHLRSANRNLLGKLLILRPPVLFKKKKCMIGFQVITKGQESLDEYFLDILEIK